MQNYNIWCVLNTETVPETLQFISFYNYLKLFKTLLIINIIILIFLFYKVIGQCLKSILSAKVPGRWPIVLLTCLGLTPGPGRGYRDPCKAITLVSLGRGAGAAGSSARWCKAALHRDRGAGVLV